jgi:hypothetical protein
MNFCGSIKPSLPVYTRCRFRLVALLCDLPATDYGKLLQCNETKTANAASHSTHKLSATGTEKEQSEG